MVNDRYRRSEPGRLARTPTRAPPPNRRQEEGGGGGGGGATGRTTHPTRTTGGPSRRPSSRSRRRRPLSDSEDEEEEGETTRGGRQPRRRLFEMEEDEDEAKTEPEENQEEEEEEEPETDEELEALDEDEEEEEGRRRARRHRHPANRTVAALPEGDWYTPGHGPQCTFTGPPGFDQAAAWKDLRKRGLPLHMFFGVYKGMSLRALRRLPDFRHYVSYFMGERMGFFDQFCDIDANMLLLESLYYLRMLCFVKDRFGRRVRVVDMLKAHKQAIAQGGKRQRVGTGVMKTIAVAR